MNNKALKLGVLMDDIANIKPYKDSSFAMMLEAQDRGYEIYTFDTTDLYAKKDQVFTSACKTQVTDNNDNYYNKQTSEDLNLSTFDVILMRKDPPFNMNYIYSTYLLEQAEKQGVLVVNKPASLRDANEKLFALNFSDLIPKTLVSSNFQQINKFINDLGVAIIKPLDGMGGKDIFKLDKDSDDINNKVNYLTNNGQNPIITQGFLPDISKGDKRILLIDGKPIKYSLARMPAKGSFKGNLAAGATGIGQPLSERDLYLCEKVGPTLKKMGLMFVGMDVIGDYITEINVTSPTCIRELDEQFNLNIAGELFDTIEQQLP